MATKESMDLLVMKFLHYFITEKNYNPVVVHGIQNEIWLENMDNEIKIVRLVMNYIHNKEQLDYDTFKINRLSSQIKRKTFTFNMKVLTLYLDINEDVKLENTKKYFFVDTAKKNFTNNDSIKKYFSDMKDKLKFTEKGAELYQKINNDILKKNFEQTNQVNEIFKPKKPIITNILMVLISVMFILMYLLGKGSEDIETLYLFGALIKKGSILRVVTSIFLHIGIIHFVSNMWALKILGKQTESFYGHIKMFIIFLYSGIIGNLLSVILMSDNTISAGASGAIFGIMGALLYFALNQRTYMSDALKNEILPVIILNLFLSVALPTINLYAHLGGFIGGMLISGALGIKYKTSRFEKINGSICSVILLVVLIYLGYYM